MRKTSEEQSKSLPLVILTQAKASTKLTPDQHRLAQDYLSIHLSIRDREQIVKVLCHSNPDHLTTGVRTLVESYDPMIRKLHQAVDLSGTVSDLEVFLKDMIKLSKIPDPSSRTAKDYQTPSVGDFIELLHKHQGASHRFIHQCGKNGPELMSWFSVYLHAAADEFKRKDSSTPTSTQDAGDLTPALTQLFTSLPKDKQSSFQSLLDTHASYLKALHASSLSRLDAVLSSPRTNHPALQSTSKPTTASRPPSAASSRAPSPERSSTTISAGAAAHAAKTAHPGPGAYLARWQALIEATAITPATAEGPVRRGGSGSVLKASRNDGADAEAALNGGHAKGGDEDGEEEKAFADAMEQLDAELEGTGAKGGRVKRPDTSEIVEAMGAKFREVLGKRACTW